MKEFDRHVKEGRIALKFRRESVWLALEGLMPKPDKPVLLSGIGTSPKGKSWGEFIQHLAMTPSLFADPARTVQTYVRQLQQKVRKSCGPNATVICGALKGLLGHWQLCAERNWKCQIWDRRKFYLAGAFEDPAGFFLGLKTRKGREFARKAFAEEVRSKVDTHFKNGRAKPKSDLSNDYTKIYEWYNRAYHRAIAQQHGATVIESTFVRKFPKYMRTQLRKWKSDSPHDASPTGPRLMSAHLLALAELPEVKFLDLRARLHESAAQRPNAVAEQLEHESFWRERRTEYLRRCAPLGAINFASVDPQFRLLCGTVSNTWHELDEYRIFDSISPAGVQINVLGSLGEAEQYVCSLVEFHDRL
jgi:hypothetical protein